jgi:hypothetical protein
MSPGNDRFRDSCRRTLLNEVSLPGSRVRRCSAAALSQVWNVAESPPRAGLTTWRPYEALSPPRQEAMMKAAAFALDLIQAEAITAHERSAAC